MVDNITPAILGVGVVLLIAQAVKDKEKGDEE